VPPSSADASALASTPGDPFAWEEVWILAGEIARRGVRKMASRRPSVKRVSSGPMRRVLFVLFLMGCGGPKGLPKMPPPDYEESPDPWAEAGSADAGAE